MDRVVFSNGIAFSVKETGDGSEEKRSKLDSLLLHLDCIVEFENTTTLADIWKYIKKDASSINVIFFQAMGGHDLKPFLKQFDLPVSETDESLDAIELYWDIKIYNSRMDISTNCHGIGSATKDMPIECQGKIQNYAIEFTPINELKNLTVKLKKECVLKESGKDIPCKSSRKITKEWTVYDMIKGLLDELSFFGSPSNQLRTVASFDQILAEVNDNLDKLK